MKRRLFLAAACALIASRSAGAAPSLADAAGEYGIESAGSAIRFDVPQLAGRGISGAFRRFAGTIHIDAADIRKSSVDIDIFPESVSTGQARVDAFLRSNAVFDIENEKAITFRSTSVRPVGEDAAILQGRLTARGRKADESFRVSLGSFSRSAIVFHVTGRILRSRYGMDVGTPIYSNIVDFDMVLRARRH